MNPASVTVAVPTLSADDALRDCVRSLEQQTFGPVDVVIIDNSGKGRVRFGGWASAAVRIIENRENQGFGRAINQAFQVARTPYLATLNDDAVASPGWLASLVSAMEADPGVGMCASQVRLAEEGTLDSAGMLICADASSKQRGHGLPPSQYPGGSEALFPSGSAALYRRTMLEQVGVFDNDFFLYCEDTDLGLRARWAGWRCRYVPDAVVEHRYSHSAGRVSALKAYYVERNRLFVAVKNFPASWLLRAPFAAVARYFWHAWLAREGQGAAGRFEGGSLRLAWLVVKAHLALLRHLPTLLRQRRDIRRTARVTSAQFSALLREYAISPREIAAL